MKCCVPIEMLSEAVTRDDLIIKKRYGIISLVLLLIKEKRIKLKAF